MRILRYISLIILCALAMMSCIEDGVSSNASEQPVFSVDTLKMGEYFSQACTPTSRFIVYNRYDKIMNIQSISLSGSKRDVFRLNVDGISGKSFNNIQIRPNDSIFVFVEANLPLNDAPGQYKVECNMDFVTHGKTNTVVLSALSENIIRFRAQKVEKDTWFTARLPFLVYDSLIVAENAKMTVDANARIYLHDGAYIKVYGTLVCNGTAEQPVNFTGDRSGFVASDIPYELMSGQWDGIYFAPTSKNNNMTYTSVRNTSMGIVLDNVGASPALTMIASQVHNSEGTVLAALHSDVNAYACEFSEAGMGLVYLQGGKHTFNHCTFANNYLFSAISGAAVQFYHLNAETDDESGKPYVSANIDNCIIYGIGADLSHGDLTGTSVKVRNTLLKSKGEDDDNFIKCIWGEDPLFYTVRSDYYFDYRLQAESPAIGAADPSLTSPSSRRDRYGNVQPAKPDLGAYVYRERE